MATEFLRRKDLARITTLSVDVIRRNEERLGLAAMRRQINQRLIDYPAARAIQSLKARGVL